ncbi:unnamed protein product [Rotaria socialis]
MGNKTLKEISSCHNSENWYVRYSETFQVCVEINSNLLQEPVRGLCCSYMVVYGRACLSWAVAVEKIDIQCESGNACSNCSSTFHNLISKHVEKRSIATMNYEQRLT